MDIPINNTIYTSLKQCSQATKIPYQILRGAKQHPKQKGFTANGRIYWEQAGVFIKDNWTELNSADSTDNLLKWKTKKTKAEAFLAEIELDEAKQKFVNRDDVVSSVKAIALSQKTLLKTKLTQEVPARLLGMDIVSMSVELEKVVNECCSLMENLVIK